MKYSFIAVLFALSVTACSKETNSIAAASSEIINNDSIIQEVTLTPAQQVCRSAVSNINFEKDTIRDWFDQLTTKCKSLTKEDQKIALKNEINENGIIHMFDGSINEIAQTLRDGKRPFNPEFDSFLQNNGWH